MCVNLSVETPPRPMPRPRFTRQGRCYVESGIREYQAKIRAAAIKAGCTPQKGDLSLSLKCYRKVRAGTRRFGDVDNLYKAVADALNGICYADDSQITRCSIEKHTSGLERVEIEICAADAN